MIQNEGLLNLKKDMNEKVMDILDAQDMPKEDREGIKEFFSYMSSLKPDDLKKLKEDPKFLKASQDFKKDRSKSENIINTCKRIIEDADSK